MYNGNMKNKLPRKYRIISRVCRSDAPENLASSRYAGMHNGDAGDTKTAKTLVLSGFAGGGYLSPVRLSHTQCALIHGNPLKADDHCYVIPQRECAHSTVIVTLRGGHSPLLHLGNPLKADDHRYVIPQRECAHSTVIFTLRDLKQKIDTS